MKDDVSNVYARPGMSPLFGLPSFIAAYRAAAVVYDTLGEEDITHSAYVIYDASGDCLLRAIQVFSFRNCGKLRKKIYRRSPVSSSE
jgi:hypothetical protein